jgi:hypothetical protein
MQKRSNSAYARRARARNCAAAWLSLILPGLAAAQAVQAVPTVERPVVLPNRFEENWSVLADPDVPRKPGGALKYIPLPKDDPSTYLSLGADFRE